MVVFFFFSLSITWCIVMYQFSILNCFIFSFWRAVFIREFSFPLLLSFTYCTFLYVYVFLFCTLVKRIFKLKLKLKLQVRFSWRFPDGLDATYCNLKNKILCKNSWTVKKWSKTGHALFSVRESFAFFFS